MLSEPGVLEHFFPDEPEKVAKIRGSFTELWGLEKDDALTRSVIKATTKKIIIFKIRPNSDYYTFQKAIEHPSEFVLKSQMDGGHGIFFDGELVEKLKSMSLEERGAYILMKKIKPVVAKVQKIEIIRKLENYLI